MKVRTGFGEKGVQVIRNTLLAVAGMLIATSGNVLAQAGVQDGAASAQPMPSEAGKRRQIEQVVSSARKMAREEVAQDVPIASTVVDAATIEINHYMDIRDVAKMVPSTDFRETSTFPGIQRFWLRGTGTSFSTPNFDPVVGVIIDGVFISQNIAANLDTFDLESLEILRGPQGTLFGRNLAGGAVIATSRRPGDEFAVRGKASYGRFNDASISLGIEGPIVKEKLAAGLAVQYRDRGGYIRNNLPPNKNIGQYESWHIKPVIKFTPSDSFDYTIIGEYTGRRGDGAVSVSFPPGPGMDDLVNPQLLARTGSATRAWRETWSDQNVVPTHSIHDVFRITGEGNWDLGHGVITSVTGYINVDALSGAEFDGLPNINVTTTRIWVQQDQISQELRYASKFSEVWDFTAGLYFFTQDLTYGEQRFQTSLIGRGAVGKPGVAPGNPFGLGFAGYDLLKHKEYAGFLETHIHFFDSLTLTLGGRYSHEVKDVQSGLVNSGSCISSGKPFEDLKTFSCPYGKKGGFDIVDKESWNSFSPKVVLDYKINDDVLVYTSWARGFRSGGWSFRASPTELNAPDFRAGYYKPEKVSSFEGGLKGDFFDSRLRTNLAVFYSKWIDIQRSLQFGSEGGSIFQTTLNVPKSHVWGLEAEINAIVAEDFLMSSDSLRFDAAFGWFESGYDVFIDFEPDGIDDRNRPFPSPDTTVYVGLTYDHPLGNAGILTWRGSFRYASGYSSANNAKDRLGVYAARQIVDASVRYEAPGGEWYASVYGRNLLDDHNYEAQVTFVANQYGVANPEMPRTWGVELGFKF